MKGKAAIQSSATVFAQLSHSSVELWHHPLSGIGFEWPLVFGSDMQIKQGEMTSISAGRQERAADEVCMQSVKHKARPHQHT